VIIIAGGLVLLGAFLFIGSRMGSGAMVTAAKLFIPVWFVAAGINMWMGVARAGYSVAEELPIFLIIFAIPAASAAFMWWKAP